MQANQPYFSILIPCFKRPALARDALLSALSQTFLDYEIVLSNNGSDVSVLESIKDLLDGVRIHYVEPPSVLSMPDHWEFIRKHAKGKYILVLTDRSVLKPNALKLIKNIHIANPSASSVVSWGWDTYFNNEKIIIKHHGKQKYIKLLSNELLYKIARFAEPSHYKVLPRGLNSCISAEVINAIVIKTGSAFDRINPDFTIGYKCLHAIPEFIYVDQALMVSQGLVVSNGANAAKGDGADYMKSIGLKLNEAFDKLPFALPFIASSVSQDFLRICEFYGNSQNVANFSRANFYIECLKELEHKKRCKVLDWDNIKLIENEIEASLSKEANDVQYEVECQRKSNTGLISYLYKTLQKIHDNYTPKILQPVYLQMRGGLRVKSVFDSKAMNDLILDSN